MSGNPRTQPLSTSSQGPPNWLFSNNSNNSSTSAPSNSTAPAMAKKNQKAAKAAVAPTTAAASSTSQNQAPPDQLMDLVESFLSDQGFDNAHREFQKHRAKKGLKGQNAGKQKNKAHHSLVSIFQTWETFSSQANTPIIPKEDPLQKITKVSSSSSESDSSDDSSSESSSDSDDSKDVAMADAPVDDESSSSESSSSDDSDSDSDSESDDEKETSNKPATGAVTNGKNPLKRKAVSESSSSSDSDSDSDMSDSSSEDERPQTKKVKTKASSDESSSSSSESSDDESSDDEDEDSTKKVKQPQVDDESSSSESESDSSDSESDEESKVDLKAAAAVPLPESGSSSSDSESDSESEDEKPQRPSKGVAPNGAGSDTSVTLDKASPESASASFPPLPPDPVASKMNNRGKNGAKTQNQPFSRIRKDVAIDPRLSSNAYVSHEYGDKAHQDLIVTKGKGFTKEKNKKKRGSYKGGPLDINKSRSIKFDD
ncbi:SRP40, C-terminal domain-containing protein [Daldinia loculata]|uniref:SRP40, C-terminal domain-containing protein n=1 Tax=Daldinia loculata TaxID=103429 RepID=UPI0020C30D38|nr:SRP40, C-terminal domain-containing protein [Daldinia loculata]KAI1651088.1 SRP40, C-terminal domain-containing protein [Daldinia loculata]